MIFPTVKQKKKFILTFRYGYGIYVIFRLQVLENPRYKEFEQKIVCGIHGSARSGHKRARRVRRMADQILGM